MRFIVGLIIVVLATTMMVKATWLVENFGYSNWAERVLGTFGGTRLMIKLIGLVIIFISFLYMTGLHESLLNIIARILVPGR